MASTCENCGRWLPEPDDYSNFDTEFCSIECRNKFYEGFEIDVKEELSDFTAEAQG